MEISCSFAELNSGEQIGLGAIEITTVPDFSILTGKGEKGQVSIIVNSDGGGNAGENSAISIDLRSVGTKPTEYTYTAGA